MNNKLPENVPENFDILKIKAEELAAQLTLRDLPVFKNISAEELTSGSWSQKNKNEIAPNIAEFTYRFNVICLWTQREILNATKNSRRVQLIEYFIKVSKKLLLLNNIHGAFAVTSALLCHSIFRLTKSWTKIGWHEKSTFEKLKKLFSADNNWESLRKLTDSRKTPCIPHIGIYLTDLMFIQNAIKQKHIPLALGEKGIHQNNMDSLIRTLASFQDSVYDDLELNPMLQEYLSNIYIDREHIRAEEDKLYNLSLFQEPQATPSTPRNSSLTRLSHFSWKLTRSSTPKLETPISSKEVFQVDPQLKTKSLTPNLSLLKGPSKFRKGHKKTFSHGDAISLGIDNSAFMPASTSTEAANLTADSLDNFLDQSCFNSTLKYHIPEITDDHFLDSSYTSESPMRRARKDSDSPDCLCNGFDSLKLSRNTPRSSSVFGRRKDHSRLPPIIPIERKGSLSNFATDQILQNGRNLPKIQGMLYRSTVRRSKNKPVLLRYSQRIWVELHQQYFFEFERKTIVFHHTCERYLYRSTPRRIINLKDSSWKIVRSLVSSDTFELHHSQTGAIVVYRCQDSHAANEWSSVLSHVNHEEDDVDAMVNL
uniref:Ras-GEF domain-containing protein n=1 Tax=Panagrolaimus sp. ES5 TaxID=591445 RepID=A0AC34F2Z2_9BILA